MEETVFAKIIRRELPADIVYEDEHTLAFLDQMPDDDGHTLVVPKKFARNIFDIDEETFVHVMRTVHHIVPKIRTAVGADGIRIIMNNEPAGGQAVFYLHVHLIPFWKERPPYFPQKERAPKEVLAPIAQKIRDAIAS